MRCVECGAPPVGQLPVAAEEPSDSRAAPSGQLAKWARRAQGPRGIIGLGLLALIIAGVIAATMSSGHRAEKTSTGHQAEKRSSRQSWSPPTLGSLTEEQLQAGDCLQVPDLGNDSIPWPELATAVSCTLRRCSLRTISGRRQSHTQGIAQLVTGGTHAASGRSPPMME